MKTYTVKYNAVGVRPDSSKTFDMVFADVERAQRVVEIAKAKGWRAAVIEYHEPQGSGRDTRNGVST